MCIIVVTVVTQSARAPVEERGNFDGLMFINIGVFQAIGVISFGRTVVGLSCFALSGSYAIHIFFPFFSNNAHVLFADSVLQLSSAITIPS